jgi:2-amino-4-hydroxy-6-hydroxymethyldihydropteridine diphosphokinase
MTIAGLGLGSNMGDRAGYIAHALTALESCAGIIAARAPLYQTPPWGDVDQDDFLNTCVLIDTGLSALDLLKACLDIENVLGRTRTRRWGPRTIDIDVLFYGDEVMATPELTLPHPYIFERSFVVVPLADIAPDKIITGVRVWDAAQALLKTNPS